MLDMCENPPNRMCPFCGEIYEDNAEYVDVGVGGRGVQVTASNVCENKENIIVTKNGYIVTDGLSFVHTFLVHAYGSRQACFYAAITIAFHRETVWVAITRPAHRIGKPSRKRPLPLRTKCIASVNRNSKVTVST